MKHFRLLTALLVLFAAPAQAGKAHVHGQGVLDVAIEGDTITLVLALPLEVLVGFERAPRNEAERAALAAAEQRLREPAGLFVPSAAAACSARAAEVDMPVLGAGEHADVVAQYRFACAAPAALKGIEAAVFAHFPRLHRLDTQRIGPRGQGGQRLTPRQPLLSW